MDDYTVKYVELPLKVGGITVLPPDEFSIYINRLLPDGMQAESLTHEKQKSLVYRRIDRQV